MASTAVALRRTPMRARICVADAIKSGFSRLVAAKIFTITAVFAVALGLCTHTSVLFTMLRAIAALLAASGAAGLVPTRRSVARVINAGGEEDYVNPVTEFLGRFIPKQAPLELGVDWDQPKTPLPLGELAGALDRGLREREWFVTGKVLPEYFSDDFKFEDPDVSFSA